MQKAYGGRFGDITLPLLKIIRLVAPDGEQSLRDLFDGMEKGRRSEKSRTLEGDILTAMLALETHVVNGKLPLKRVVAALNIERKEKDALAERFVSPRLRSLGFQLTSRNPTDIIWNAELLEQCLINYGIKDSFPSPETSSQSSQSSQAKAENPQENQSDHESVERQNPVGEGELQLKDDALNGAEVF